MDWIQNLLFNDASVAHTVILYAFVIALGVALGKMKFFGISLGVTFVLFVGLIAGHFGFSAEKNILHFVQEFGLILFIYSIGLQVGPSFFSSFKKGGLTLNMLAVGIVILNIAVALTLYFIHQGEISMPMMVGILSGAVTNTPGLGAAQQTLSQLKFDGSISEVPEIALVTRPEFNGRKIGSLRLRMGYRLNATRVNRAGLDLLANPNLELQIGDRLTVVGRIEDINRLAEKLGNSTKRLHEPNMVTLFVGIFLGIILGSIPLAIPGMSVPMKLGLAGGPLVVAILLGRFGHKIHLVTYTSTGASLMLREIGICLFLASVGISAGGEFVNTIMSGGLIWVWWGFLITVIPLLIIGIIARAHYKINYCSIMGLLSGACTDPPALAYGNKVSGNDAPSVAYSTVYPLAMFLRVLSAQLLILLFY